MPHVLYVGIGSAAGGLARYASIGLALSLFGPAWPVGTLTVNVVGSFAIGVLAACFRPESRVYVRPHVRALLAVGFCGGFTTFSFFAWQVFVLSGFSLAAAAGYALLSPLLAIIAAWGGYRLVVNRTSSRP